jgi:hypothetical protein
MGYWLMERQVKIEGSRHYEGWGVIGLGGSVSPGPGEQRATKVATTKTAPTLQRFAGSIITGDL